MIKFLHAADLHLDTPFTARGAESRQEQRQLVEELFELANAETCDLVLLAGDVFDGSNIYPQTVETLRDAMAKCRAQVFIAPGNHDHLRTGSPYLTAQWPENVHIFREPRITSVSLTQPRCRVYGVGFTAPNMGKLLQGFHVEDEAEPGIMVMHGEVAADSAYNAISAEEIAASGLDYLALGHIHLRDEMRQAGRTFYAMPGCPMGRGFKETGDKGVYIGTLDGGNCKLTFRPLSGRRYEELSVAVGDDPQAAVTAALEGKDARRDLYRIALTGEAEKLDLPALEEALKPLFFSLELQDQTVPKRDLWAGAGEGTLRGQFLARLTERYDTETDDEARRLIASAARLGLDAIEGRDEEVLS
ncbi:MAG: DNA repair exonuclease [Oscillospiraceae bacterium]|nr:DNA repair exonuclease [Oscillospiraceae bacterium]